jgi:AcrR family transcriptional regulator
MARWEPDARGRLEKAAMELFRERGYVGTTVQDIAAHAGLTERTFFRYFADKREVLFSGSRDLEKAIVDVITSAPKELAQLDVVGAAFEAAGATLQARRELSYVRARYALLAEHAELRERELIKMASLAAVVTKTLHARGVTDPAASLLAEAGIAVFKIGFELWVTHKKPSDLATHIRAALDTLKHVTAEPSAPAKRASPRRGSK